MSEHSLQCALVQHLRFRARPDVLWMAIPNGEHRSARTGARLKAQGVIAGAPDILLIIDGVAHGLELKTEKGRMSAAQLAMEARWRAAGGDYRVAKGIDEALLVLEDWGVFSVAHMAEAAE